MQQIEVKQIDIKDKSIDDLSIILDSIEEKNYIDKISWGKFNYKPKVYFKMAHSLDQIFIKYYVEESEFLATKLSTNDNVFEDSCVEFFLSLDGANKYYNMEFNFHGTCQMGNCSNKDDMELLPTGIIKRIKTKSFMQHKFTEKGNSIFTWELLIIIPLEVFIYDEINSLKGKTLNANFYKCGDKLKNVHYVSWNRIETKTPNFHQPKYFGELKFV